MHLLLTSSLILLLWHIEVEAPAPDAVRVTAPRAWTALVEPSESFMQKSQHSDLLRYYLGLHFADYPQTYIEQGQYNTWHLLTKFDIKPRPEDVFVWQTRLPALEVPVVPERIARDMGSPANREFTVAHVYPPSLFFDFAAALYRSRQATQRAETDILGTFRTLPTNQIPGINVAKTFALRLSEKLSDTASDNSFLIRKPPRALIKYLNSLTNLDGTNRDVAEVKDWVLVSLYQF